MDNIELIKLLYPEVYEGARKLYTFEKQVHQLIDDTYGKDSLDSIIQLNEFNKEIDNVQKGVTKNTQLNRLAQKYSKYFDEYSKLSYSLKIQIGSKDTLSIMDTLQNYFKKLI